MFRVRILAAALLLAIPITIRNLEAQTPTNTVTRSDVTVGATAIQVCPANGSRIDCSCTNNDGAIAVRVGDANVTASRGQRVTAGSTFKASTTGTVFAISEGGNALLSCTDQTR